MSLSIGGKVLYEPQERQSILHSTYARQILYGGAAGGGKSHSLRWDLITLCLANPGCQAYLFRRTRPELEQTHIQMVKMELGETVGKYSETRNAYEFLNGSSLHMCYCEREADLARYLSAEMHVIAVDEASTFSEQMLQFLKTRNRLGGWEPKEDKPVEVSDGKGGKITMARLPRFVMGSNPGNVGHSYLKMTFIDPVPPETYFYDRTMRDPNNPDDKGWLSIFIPAKIRDNIYLDTDYAASFGGLPPELAKAYRDGNWDVVVGAALHTLAKDRHQLRPFTPPKHWTRFQVMDWGTASPFSIGWYCVSEGAILAQQEKWPERWLPEGAIIRYAEWYGWNGKPNQGCRFVPQKVGRGILGREEGRAEVMDYRVADNEIWAQKSGRAAVDWFQEEDPRLVFRKSIKDRKRNYQECLARLAGNPRYMEDGSVEEDPMFFCTANCIHFWRTVPPLTYDEVDHEKGPGDRQSDENHCLSGDTRIITSIGLEPLSSMFLYDPNVVKVWTYEGWRDFADLGCTIENADVWCIKLAGHEDIIATPNHRFLCADGEYRRLDELTYADYIACSDPPDGIEEWGKISSARRIGSVGATIREVGSAFIGLCGSITTAPYRRVCTFITSTATALTTALRTWNSYPLLFTSRGTRTSPATLNTPSGTWKPGCGPRPSNGTDRKQEESGTPSVGNSMRRFRRALSLFVRSAARKVWPSVRLGRSALMPATKGNFAVAILDIIPNYAKSDVYNIHVSETNAFTLENGAIVHNCYDEWAYALRSNPYVTTEKDRYFEEFGDEIRRAKGRVDDPYATR